MFGISKLQVEVICEDWIAAGEGSLGPSNLCMSGMEFTEGSILPGLH